MFTELVAKVTYIFSSEIVTKTSKLSTATLTLTPPINQRRFQSENE